MKKYIILIFLAILIGVIAAWVTVKIIDYASSVDSNIIEESLDRIAEIEKQAAENMKRAQAAEAAQAAADAKAAISAGKLKQQNILIEALNNKIANLVKISPDCDSIDYEKIDFQEAKRVIAGLCKLNYEYLGLIVAYRDEDKISVQLINDLDLSLSNCNIAKNEYRTAAETYKAGLDEYKTITIPEYERQLKKARWGFYAGVGGYFGFGNNGKDSGICANISWGRELKLPKFLRFFTKKKSPKLVGPGL